MQIACLGCRWAKARSVGKGRVGGAKARDRAAPASVPPCVRVASLLMCVPTHILAHLPQGMLVVGCGLLHHIETMVGQPQVAVGDELAWVRVRNAGTYTLSWGAGATQPASATGGVIERGGGARAQQRCYCWRTWHVGDGEVLLMIPDGFG